MLNYSRVFQYINSIERLSVCCKCTFNGRTNLIKSYNSENKYLYGRLLETQRQRRRKANKASSIISEESLKNSSEESINQNTDDILENKTVKRTRKSKVSPLSTAPTDSTTLGLHFSNTNPSVVLPPQNADTELGHSISAKRGIRKTKSNNSGAEVQPPSKPDQFVFKSTVVINENNYPLENSNKNYLTNSVIDNVLSFNFSDPLIRDYIKLPSVSKIMEGTMSEKNKLILNKWRQNMISDLGEEGFNKYSADLKTRGHDFHSAVKAAILGKPMDSCSEVTKNALKSLAWMLKYLTDPMAVESITAHPTLGYKGIPDCVAIFRDVPVVVDWKLSDKPKKDLKETYDAPVQVTAYIGAVNHDPNYKWAVNHGLIAVAYTNGDPCDVFLLAPKHCQIYWRHWLMRFDKFKALSTKSNLHLDHNIDEKDLQ